MRKDIAIPIIKGVKNITSMSFIAVVIFPYTPRIIRTKEPEMPGKRNAVKASSPAKTRRKGRKSRHWGYSLWKRKWSGNDSKQT